MSSGGRGTGTDMSNFQHVSYTIYVCDSGAFWTAPILCDTVVASNEWEEYNDDNGV